MTMMRLIRKVNVVIALVALAFAGMGAMLVGCSLYLTVRKEEQGFRVREQRAEQTDRPACACFIVKQKGKGVVWLEKGRAGIGIPKTSRGYRWDPEAHRPGLLVGFSSNGMDENGLFSPRFSSTTHHPALN